MPFLMHISITLLSLLLPSGSSTPPEITCYYPNSLSSQNDVKKCFPKTFSLKGTKGPFYVKSLKITTSVTLTIKLIL